MMDYELRINNQSKGEPYFFSYGNTKEIILQVSYNRALISRSLAKNYLPILKGSYLMDLMREGMKRASLIHLLLYQKPLKIRDVKLIVSSKNKICESITLTEEFALYSMIECGLLRPLSKEWKEHTIIQFVLKHQKSTDKMARQISALYAYLYSKTRKYETERFNYLWIAMNGLFAALDPKDSGNDRNQMCALVKRYGFGTNLLDKTTRERSGKLTMIHLLQMPEPVTRDSLDSDSVFTERIMKEVIDKYGKPVDVSLYGYMLTDFPYYLRCKLFHANRPLELFSFTDDMELKSLRIANGLLEEFLDKELISLFRGVTM